MPRGAAAGLRSRQHAGTIVPPPRAPAPRCHRTQCRCETPPKKRARDDAYYMSTGTARELSAAASLSPGAIARAEPSRAHGGTHQSADAGCTGDSHDPIIRRSTNPAVSPSSYRNHGQDAALDRLASLLWGLGQQDASQVRSTSLRKLIWPHAAIVAKAGCTNPTRALAPLPLW